MFGGNLDTKYFSNSLFTAAWYGVWDFLFVMNSYGM